MRYLPLISFLLFLCWHPKANSQSCLPDGITFTTQSQIDSFPILYSNCTEIEGDVRIPYPNNISSLVGLNAITAIGGELLISDCEELTTLNGLNNLQSIGEGLSLISNNNLLNLYALQNLRTIGGGLTISWNYRIKSLSGIDSLNAETITALHMIFNDSLSWCAVESVCQYISNPSGYITIINNAFDCNSVEVVMEFCEHIGVSEQPSDPLLSAYPNPFTTSTTIEYELKQISDIQFTVYNVMGERVHYAEYSSMPQGNHKVTWSPGQLPEGMYYAVLRSEEGVSVVKMLKE